jgi:hypothetical protein
MKNEKLQRSPLIDRILVIGPNEEELYEHFTRKSKESNISNINLKILEDYKSHNLRESSNENYIENITSVNFILTSVLLTRWYKTIRGI